MARILIIDDEALCRATFREILETAGHTVVEAGDGQVGCRLAGQEGPFDIVVTDMRMPKKEGFETIEHFKQNHPDTAIIAISGWNGKFETAEIVLEHAADVGAAATLRKPVSGDDLVAAVARLLAATRA